MKSPVKLGPVAMVSPLGIGLQETLAAILSAGRYLGPLTLFPIDPSLMLPVGEISSLSPEHVLPRTHQLVRLACDQLRLDDAITPDAVVVGTTTGGISLTEELLLEGESDPRSFRLHGAHSIAKDLAARYGCMGPTITVSAACASGAMAIALGTEMIRKRLAKRVLAGGADGMCRLTYFGFKSLQLIDPDGARPLDQARRGMSVAEGAAFVLLLDEPVKENEVAILGCGLSCDAFHATAPHPNGEGAYAAMQAALADAGLPPTKVSYINLHGTATPDNDASEAKALNALFGPKLPPHSSIKGAMGHSLAASGAIEAGLAALCIQRGVLPANVGMQQLDSNLHLAPVTQPEKKKISAVLSNSFGFGGSNAALVFGQPEKRAAQAAVKIPSPPFSVLNYACVTGAGFLDATINALLNHQNAAGCLDSKLLCKDLKPAWIRRAKRLTRLALALAAKVCADDVQKREVGQLLLGTGWGSLSETHAFLTRLFETDYQFPSPTDFIGSVHNAPAGQIAQFYGIKGANVTTSGGDYAFEQALLSAELLHNGKAQNSLVIGVDQAHSHLSPLFDPSCPHPNHLADGGGALVLSKAKKGLGVTIDLPFYGQCHAVDNIDALIQRLIGRLNGVKELQQKFSVMLVGLPFGCKSLAEKQLNVFQTKTGFKGPLLDYRHLVGQFAGAASIAAVLAVHWVKTKNIPPQLFQKQNISLDDRGILILNFGDAITAMRILLS
jgi:3-oxoacyl-(acyl-carrier-protein) synthase